MKSTRARSPERKKEQMDRIIVAGAGLFVTRGADGFIMRELAGNLGMSPGNLYHYVATKRELWFAIIGRYYEGYVNGLEKIISDHEGGKVELLEKIAYYYIDTALTDLPAYRMMNMIPPPPAASIGPFEESHESRAIVIVTSVVRDAIDAGEIRKDDPNYLTYYLWSTLHGAISLYVETEGPGRLSRPENFRDYADYMLRKLMNSLK